MKKLLLTALLLGCGGSAHQTSVPKIPAIPALPVEKYQCIPDVYAGEPVPTISLSVRAKSLEEVEFTFNTPQELVYVKGICFLIPIPE